MRRSVASIIFTAALIVVFGSAAYAITFGKEITNPSGKYTSVVSIWISEDVDEEPKFICTGTLIEPRIVLTAAHCVLEKSYLYYIKYGNDLLDDETELLEVSATWKDPRYSKKQKVNDVGLLLLTQEIDNAVTSPLPSEASIKKLLGTKGVKLEIAGWGQDQNGSSATYLKKLSVRDLTSFMKKNIKGWRSEVWLSVGTYNSKEKVYAGACFGDSGGPLFATLGSKNLLVGVTSWGANDCELGVPSSYVRLSYYVDRIKNEGISNLLVNEKKKNIALPQVLVEPSIVGAPKVGSTITCDSGKWSDNTSSIVISWSGPGVPTGSSSATLTLKEASAGSTVICTVTGKSQNGVTERVLNVDVPNPPKVLQPTRIVNMPASDSYKDSNIISCTPAKFSEGNTIDTYWWILSTGKPDVKLTQASSSTFNLTLDLVTKYSGSKLACQVIANGPSGEVQSNDFQEIRVVEIPRVNSVSVNGISENCVGTGCDWLGITVTCDAATNQSSTSTANFLYSWRVYDLAPWYQSEAPQSREIATGKTLLLTEAILKQASLKRLGCALSITNSTGSGTGYTAGKYVDYKNISQSDTLAPKFSLLSTSSTVVKGGTKMNFRIEVSDEFDTGLKPISNVRLIGPKFADITVNWEHVRESGDAKKGIYFLSFLLPNEYSGGIRGEYSLLVLISDNKQNSAGLIQLTTFNYVPTSTSISTETPDRATVSPVPVTTQPADPSVSITGIERTGLRIGDNAKCNTRNLELGESISFNWTYRANSNGSYSSNNQRSLGSSQAISFDTDSINSLPELSRTGLDLQHIFCDVVISNSVGRTNGSDSVYFYGLYTPTQTPTPTFVSITSSITLNITTVGTSRILRAVPDSPLPTSSVHCLRFGVANTKIGQSFDWATDASRGGCFIPDESVNNKANGVWGYPTADSLQLDPYGLNPINFVYRHSNRGIAEVGNSGDPVVQVGYPISWTITAPDGRKWATVWQAFP